MKSRTHKGVTSNAYMCVQGGSGDEKLVKRCVRTKWMLLDQNEVFKVRTS